MRSTRSRWPSTCSTATCRRPGTILPGVPKLEPGDDADLVARRSRCCTESYWTLDFEPKLRSCPTPRRWTSSRSARGWPARARLVSDVPLGTVPQRRHRLQLHPRPDDRRRRPRRRRRSRSAFRTPATTSARTRTQIAERLGSIHHEAIVEPTDLVELLPSLVHHYGEPFSDPSAVPTFYLARMGASRRSRWR